MDPLIYFWNSRILEGRPRNLLIQDTNSIFSLSQNEFLKLLFMETLGLGTWIRRWSYSMCFFIQFTLNLQLMLICWRQMLLIQTCYLKLPLYCTAPELGGILSKININKAIGVDNLPARILHTCAKELDLSSSCSFV